MKRPGIRSNAIWNIAEVAGSSVVLFLLYKLVISHLGVAALGIWSLVLAATSIARIADLGAAGGLGRYVAVSQAKGGSVDDALLYVETALITNTLFYALLGVLLYWPAWLALGLVTSGGATEQARALLPFAIGSFVLLNISNVVTAALIGFHASYAKSAVVLGALLVQAVVAVVLVKPLGLRAVALAQMAQYSIVAVVGWLLIVWAARGRFIIAVPHRFGRGALRELVGFGLRLQILNIASFPFDPITKFVFSGVGGLQALGIYELASRGILQVRQVVVAPSQNLTPLFAAADHEGPAALTEIYHASTAAIIAAASICMGAMALGSPVISVVWLGHVDPMFIVFSFILSFGWLLNIAATPGFFLGIGTGQLRWNIAGSSLSTVLTGILGGMLGRQLGGLGVAIGAMAAIGVGGWLTWYFNAKSLNLPWLPSGDAWHSFAVKLRRGARAPLGLHP